MFIFLSLTVSAVTYVKLGQQFVMFSPQLFRFFQRRANFHQVRLHLLDAYPYPFVTLHQSINQSIKGNLQKNSRPGARAGQAKKKENGTGLVTGRAEVITALLLSNPTSIPH